MKTIHKLLFFCLLSVVLSSTFCAFPKSAKTTTQKQLLAHTYGIIFNTRVIKMLKQNDTTYIYPVLTYQPKIMPLYSSAKIIDLDTTAKRMSIPVIIPDSVCRYFAYLPAMPLDSVFLRKENIVIYSPLMPTTKKGRYVIQKTVFTPTMYPDTRLSAMFFDYYFVKGDSCIYLEREEMEMIAY